jgi:hypothetical protein
MASPNVTHARPEKVGASARPAKHLVGQPRNAPVDQAAVSGARAASVARPQSSAGRHAATLKRHRRLFVGAVLLKVIAAAPAGARRTRPRGPVVIVVDAVTADVVARWKIR